MKMIRALLRLPAIAVTTVSLYLLFLAGSLPLKLVNRNTENWRHKCTKSWGRAILAIAGVEIHREGRAPKEPFFLVSNHLSYLDIAVYLSSVNGTFVAKKEMENWPVLGWIAKGLGILFIDRTKKSDVHRVNQQITDAMKRKQGIILFPEGKTSKGEEVLPFRPALLEHPVRAGMPVYYSSVTYRTGKGDAPAEQAVCWWGDEPLFAHARRLAGLKKIRCDLIFGEKPLKADDRKELGRELHREVTSIFRPVDQELPAQGNISSR